MLKADGRWRLGRSGAPEVLSEDSREGQERFFLQWPAMDEDHGRAFARFRVGHRTEGRFDLLGVDVCHVSLPV